MNTKQELLQELIDNDEVIVSKIDESLVTGYKGLYNRVIKRIIDIILATVIIIIIFLILIVVSIAILIEDGTPILYRAQRDGFHGKSFEICKFRSMIKNADKVGSGTTALNDKRITKVGNILRKTKIDEFSNQFNIITGEMSFIGDSEIIGTTKKSLDFTRVLAA